MKGRPNIAAQRLTRLRDSVHLSQAKLGAELGLRQPDIYRYENAQSFPPYGVLMSYAESNHISSLKSNFITNIEFFYIYSFKVDKRH